MCPPKHQRSRGFGKIVSGPSDTPQRTKTIAVVNLAAANLKVGCPAQPLPWSSVTDNVVNGYRQATPSFAKSREHKMSAARRRPVSFAVPHAMFANPPRYTGCGSSTLISAH
jgi:hypothetical protein